MSKKSKRKQQQEPLMDKPQEIANQEIANQVSGTPANPPPLKPAPTLTGDLLKDVRVAALKLSADAAHNIAELESWRNEIDATIAFLRAQRK